MGSEGKSCGKGVRSSGFRCIKRGYLVGGCTQSGSRESCKQDITHSFGPRCPSYMLNSWEVDFTKSLASWVFGKR